MPPEMILRLPHSYTADIWSFGISLLELTNKHPPTALHKVRAMWISAVGKVEAFEEPEKWSTKYKDFMSKCLEKDPDRRSSAEELLKVRCVLYLYSYLTEAPIP
jgi:serine/threonine protein kinase